MTPRARRIIGGQRYVNVGKARAGRLLDGIEHNGMPEAQP